MNLRITVEGRSYDVQVSMLDDAGQPRAATGGSVSGLGVSAIAPSAAVLAAAEARTKSHGTPGRPAPAPVKPVADTTHHIYGPLPAKPGEVVCPVAGVIVEVPIKAGQRVQQHASLAVLEVSKSISTGDRAFVGTVRSTASGTVSEVLVKPGDNVRSGQVLCRLSEG